MAHKGTMRTEAWIIALVGIRTVGEFAAQLVPTIGW